MTTKIWRNSRPTPTKSKKTLNLKCRDKIVFKLIWLMELRTLVVQETENINYWIKVKQCNEKRPKIYRKEN